MSGALSYLPAVLAAATDIATAAMVRANQPDYPGRFVVFQIVMFGAALLVAVPKLSVRLVGFMLLLAGFFISGASGGWFYLPTVIAAGWMVVRSQSRGVSPNPLS